MINKINQAILKLMNGTEIMSLSYEDIVFIEGKKVIRYGEIIDRLNTNEKIERLFREMVYQEYGTNDIKKIEKMEGF